MNSPLPPIMSLGLDGPASKEDKLLYRGLRARGIPEEKMPEELQDAIVAQSKKGPLGQITVKRMTGINSNSTKRMVDRFEENIGGQGPLAEGLAAVKDDLTKDQLQLLELLSQPNKKKISRLIAEAGAEPVAVMRVYARGVMELGKVQAAIEAHKGLPNLIKDLYTHALSQAGICEFCAGEGKFKKANGAEKACHYCGQTGFKSPSELKKFATEKLLEVTKQIGEKGPLVAIQNNQVTVNQKGSVLERIMVASDEVLYKRNSEPSVVEAEIVQPESN